jgi:hypothetical protein
MKKSKHFDEESFTEDDLYNDRERIIEILSQVYHLAPGEAEELFKPASQNININSITKLIKTHATHTI